MKNSIRLRALLLAVILLFSAISLSACDSPPEVTSSNDSSETSSVIPEPITVTVGSAGDYILHNPILKNHSGDYDYTDIFKYIADYQKKFDYFVGNLETTFGGAGIGYKGNWVFNSPDTFADALIFAGVDMVCTANNHSYDSSSNGFNRTMDILDEKNLVYFGTHKDGEKNYKVVDVGGIKIGMINYTYQDGSKEVPTLNGITIAAADRDNVNTFSYNYLNDFYAEMQNNLSNMYNDGAEAIMLYIHWGNEYHQEANSYQKQIAQKMCDLGVDVIVGGHPHVVEPLDILSSSVSGKQTVCIYSLGNSLSNQFREEMPNTGKKFPHVAQGASEDGVIFSVSFTKLGTGEVTISNVDLLPTMMNKHYREGKLHFQIVPLDNDLDYKNMFDINATAAGPQKAQVSYNRTMGLMKNGLEKFNNEYIQIDLRKNK